eukprot:UN10833
MLESKIKKINFFSVEFKKVLNIKIQPVNCRVI